MRYIYQFFYNIIWHIFIVGWLVWQSIKSIKSKDKQAILDRLAIFKKTDKNSVIWFHGSSLGEVISLLPLMKTLKETIDHKAILTVSTIRGYQIAQQKAQELAEIHYLPWDVSYLMKRVLKLWHPNMVILFETELWPNLLWTCKSKKVPIALISGRISMRSYPRYRLARFFFRTILSDILLWMQSQEDAERIIGMGASKNHVQVLGDIKLDGIRTCLPQEELNKLKNLFHPKSFVWVIGSTHENEEKMLIPVYKHLLAIYPELLCILAPRHLFRMQEIMSLLDAENIQYTLRSKIEEEPHNLILLDTYGELAQVYAIADIVFIGGTLVPVGGHNLLEPAAFGKVVLFGTYINNCRLQARMLIEQGAGISCENPEVLQMQLEKLLSTPIELESRGKKGQEIILKNQGVLKKYVDAIQHILNKTTEKSLNI